MRYSRVVDGVQDVLAVGVNVWCWFGVLVSDPRHEKAYQHQTL